MSQASTLFGLMRHAPTRWNREKRIQGMEDSPLTENGQREAEQWGRHLAEFTWHRILASDLGRARQTAELVNLALQVPITTSTELREMDWGCWTGRTFKEIKSENRERLVVMEKAGWGFQPPGGENRYQVWQRGRQALVEAAATWPGQRILVISHEGMVKALIYSLCQRRYLPSEPRILNPAHLHWLSGQGGEVSLVSLNALDLGRRGP
jgi:broad specificity phosphatase PhoE